MPLKAENLGPGSSCSVSMAAAPAGFPLDLLAEVHDCHLMGAARLRTPQEPAQSSLTFIPHPSCPFGMWILVCLSPLCVGILGMNGLLLFQKIEILDDEESDLISNSEVDQMSSLLDYKVSDWAVSGTAG